VTLASAAYQRLTGPTHTVRVDAPGGSARLPRSHAGEGDALVRIPDSPGTAAAVLRWKRHKVNEPWREVAFELRNGAREAALPHQPPAGKVNYQIALPDGSLLPAAPVTLRFRGAVPAAVLICHVIAMFAAMLVSNYAGFAALRGTGGLPRLAAWTLVLLAAGGLVLGPVVQKFAFGAYWTGWPFGHDLTDNKTAVAFLAWLAAWIAMRRGGKRQAWAFGAALVTLAVFLIPHSILGSELDYSRAGTPTP
jgi:hypothetical protein